MKGYYNTNKETGSVLLNSEIHAQTQQQKILGHFRAHPFAHMARCDIERVFPRWLAASITRAIKNLADAEFIIKTNKMKMGSHGKMVHTWVLNREKFYTERRTEHDG